MLKLNCFVTSFTCFRSELYQ